MSKQRRVSTFLTLLIAATAAQGQSQSSPKFLEFDHVWIAVPPGAPERAALEKAGFRIAPEINRHEGQGTASATVEFDNAFLELIWADPAVHVDAGRERVV